MRSHHRLPKAPLIISRDPGWRDRARIGKPTPQRMVRIVRDPPGGETFRAEPHAHGRLSKPELVRLNQQRLTRQAGKIRNCGTGPALLDAKNTGEFRVRPSSATASQIQLIVSARN